MTTKRERGRDPEQNVIHPGRVVADNYTGMHGQITGVADELADDPKAIVELRFHDGITPGGHSAPLVPAKETPRAPLTYASVPPEFSLAASSSLTIAHELGYRPLVQVFDANGDVMPQERIQVTPNQFYAAGPASAAADDVHQHAEASVLIFSSGVTVSPNYTIQHHDVDSLTIINGRNFPLTVLLR